jgi:hypothetical protein
MINNSYFAKKSMAKYDWQAGLVFGRLTLTGKCIHGYSVECICECGAITWASWASVKRGLCKSCGCLNIEWGRKPNQNIKHGLTGHPIYDIFKGMEARCYNKNKERYPYYGGAGVIVCPEWRHNFMAFFEWSIANGWEPGLTIDRWPNKKGNYEPSNSRWATDKQQRRNKTNAKMVTAFGEEKCLIEWTEDVRCVVNYTMALKRLNRGWDGEKALTTPGRDNGYKPKK